MTNIELFADLVLLDGNVLTIDAKNSQKQAIAVLKNQIIAVGSTIEISTLIGKKTKVYNLEGDTVLPGLIDSHMHPGSYGVFKVRGVQCGPDLKSITELLTKLKEKAESIPDGHWIIGYTLDDLKLGRYPIREELDSVTVPFSMDNSPSLLFRESTLLSSRHPHATILMFAVRHGTPDRTVSRGSSPLIEKRAGRS